MLPESVSFSSMRRISSLKKREEHVILVSLSSSTSRGKRDLGGESGHFFEMEATGVYWKPIYNLFEGDFEMLVVNAHHLKTVPGRKTDVKDAEWIADLLQHGLLRASFIPAAPQRELRDLTRYRTRLVEERAREINRLQKTLEDTNLKLGDVVSDVMGKAARMILSALVEGETDP